VIGDVGSGKTSLLRAILGEMIYIDPKHIANLGEDERDQKYYDELQKTISNEKIAESPIKKQSRISYVE
jgi:ABC-type molybdenum transport system ATPase subunit/photorepair protein PhrA